MKTLRRENPGLCYRKVVAMLGLAWVALSNPGCASNVAERDFYDHKETTTLLRSHLEDGKPIDRGFQHPISISEERLRRILATVRVRVDARFRDPVEKPAIAADLVPRVARALSESLEQADSSEEVALLAVYKSRHLGLFSERRLTSFVAYVKDDLLTIALNRVDWNLSHLRTGSQNRKQLPKPKLGEEQMDFRLVKSPDYEAAGEQAIAVRFADPKWDAETP
ncbi:MAG: hypothetical protein QF570_09310 [Myxococcota bacterium]|jgi:hypothetical protein|nr:hypothetical protein [Myxococcota bacterium]